MAVHPRHRNRGVGSRMMAWGMARAASLDLEIFTHATVQGRGLYEKFGLRSIQKIEVDMSRPNARDEWEKLRHELGPLSFWMMWKPAGGGIYVEGERLPWERTREEVERASEADSKT